MIHWLTSGPSCAEAEKDVPRPSITRQTTLIQTQNAIRSDKNSKNAFKGPIQDKEQGIVHDEDPDLLRNPRKDSPETLMVACLNTKR